MTKFENLGVPMKDDQGNTIPGVTYIDESTLRAEDWRRAIKRTAIAGATAVALTLGYSHLVPDSAKQVVDTTVEGGYGVIGNIPLVGPALEEAARVPENLIHDGLDTFFIPTTEGNVEDATRFMYKDGEIQIAE